MDTTWYKGGRFLSSFAAMMFAQYHMIGHWGFFLAVAVFGYCWPTKN